MSNMIQQIDNSTIGIDLLKMLMLQLYSNPRCIFREYIQNSLDSIIDAVRSGILKRKKDGHVSINIERNNITIQDNGTGISSINAVKYLTDIANSIKNGTDTAGLYGVGRLSGGGYCDILEFDTSYQGEDCATVVTMDTRILRSLLENNPNNISAEEAMCKICTTHSHDAKAEDHYFIVRLKNVINSADILLNPEEILQYIREVAPIDYNVTFNSLINSSEQKEFVDRHKDVDKIRVSLNNTTDIEKQYDLEVKGSGDIIEKLRYFELPYQEKYGKMGWGWYAVTDFSIQINEEKDPNAGIRLRKHNISLDKNILNSYFKEPRGNKYFYGEIFITNEKIVPDSGRQGLAASEEADALIKSIKEYFGILHLVYNKASRLKTKLKNIQEIIDQLQDKSDNPPVAKILTERLFQNVQDFEKNTAPDSHEEVNDVINIYKDKYDRQYKDFINKLSNNNSAIVTPTVNNKPEVAKDDTQITSKSNSVPDQDSNHSNGTQTVPSNKPAAPSSHPDNHNASDNVRTIIPPADQTHTTNNSSRGRTNDIDELLKPLISKGIYTSEQLSVLRRVISTMLLVCPNAKKKNLLLLMQSAIASIE